MGLMSMAQAQNQTLGGHNGKRMGESMGESMGRFLGDNYGSQPDNQKTRQDKNVFPQSEKNEQVSLNEKLFLKCFGRSKK